jgi:hypothetical protein
MNGKVIFGLVFSLLILFYFDLSGQAVDPKLSSLEPFLNKEWTGMMKAPDGSVEWKTTCTYEPVWNGKVIRHSRSTPELNSFEEGFIYWDDLAKKPAFFFMHSKGIFTSGFVSAAGNTVTYEGKMTWPMPPPNSKVKQSYDFKNTFTFVSATEMVDKWFQNAFGPWQPGHEITFKAPTLNHDK